MALSAIMRLAATASFFFTKRELRRLEEDSKQPGFTIVPTLIFIDNNGRAKVDIALCKGKKEYDKRQTLKEKGRQKRDG